MLSPRCTQAAVIYLTIAVPLTALMWGGFWAWRQYWHPRPMHTADRHFVWQLSGWCMLILVKLTVFVCVGVDRPRPAQFVETMSYVKHGDVPHGGGLQP